MKRALAILCALCLSVEARAELPEYVSLSTLTTATEVCGSLIDADNDGSATQCTGALDVDGDGFTSTGVAGLAGKAWTDPDDTDPWVWPSDESSDGYTIPVGRLCEVDAADDGWQTAQDDGTWTTCTKHSVTPYCPSGMTCYYIDFDAGDDANGNGSGHDCSYANPCKSFKNVGYYYSGAPSTHLGNPAAGDAFIILGGTLTEAEGKYDTNYTSWGEDKYFGVRNPSGTGVISVIAYPGASPVIDPNNSIDQVSIIQFEHVLTNDVGFNVHGVEIKRGYGNGISILGATGVSQVSNVYIHDMAQSRNTGTEGCIKFHSCATDAGCWAHHFILKECYKTTYNAGNSDGAVENNVNLRIFRGLNYVEHGTLVNDVNMSSTDGDPGSVLLQIKHSDADSFTTIKNVRGAGGRYGGLDMGGPFTLQDSWIEHANDKAVFVRDVGGPTHNTDIIIQRNTLKNKIHMQPSTFWSPYTIGAFEISDNVIIDNEGVYNSGEGLLDVDCGAKEGSNTCDDQYDKLQTAGITIGGNCYDNTGAAAEKISWFPSAVDAVGDATFSAWQAVGFDTDGYVETITFDSNQNVTSSNCAGQGRYMPPSGTPTPTPTPTPTATPTPTPTPAPASQIAAPPFFGGF